MKKTFHNSSFLFEEIESEIIELIQGERAVCFNISMSACFEKRDPEEIRVKI
jgi:hypothetical protein